RTVWRSTTSYCGSKRSWAPGPSTRAGKPSRGLDWARTSKWAPGRLAHRMDAHGDETAGRDTRKQVLPRLSGTDEERHACPLPHRQASERTERDVRPARGIGLDLTRRRHAIRRH